MIGLYELWNRKIDFWKVKFSVFFYKMWLPVFLKKKKKSFGKLLFQRHLSLMCFPEKDD